jgi:hypothetical protein
MKKTDSAAVQLMAHLWGHRQEATGHSWLRMNQGLNEGLMLAVKLGLEFGENDLGEIAKRSKILHRYTITHDDLKAAKKALKAA